jgi:hypothetical protein
MDSWLREKNLDTRSEVIAAGERSLCSCPFVYISRRLLFRGTQRRNKHEMLTFSRGSAHDSRSYSRHHPDAGGVRGRAARPARPPSHDAAYDAPADDRRSNASDAGRADSQLDDDAQFIEFNHAAPYGLHAVEPDGASVDGAVNSDLSR